jgi:hypothetical protein
MSRAGLPDRQTTAELAPPGNPAGLIFGMCAPDSNRHWIKVGGNVITSPEPNAIFCSRADPLLPSHNRDNLWVSCERGRS